MSDDTQGYLVIDTETSGLFDFSKEADADGQPRMATCALVWLDQNYDVEMYADLPIKPDGWELTPAAVAVNGLTMEYLLNHGVPVQMALDRYTKAIVEDRRVVIAHNAQFDCKMMRAELRRAGMSDLFEQTRNICTMRSADKLMKGQIKKLNGKGGYPRLIDMAAHFGINYPETGHHTALADATVTAKVAAHMAAIDALLPAEVHYAKERIKP